MKRDSSYEYGAKRRNNPTQELATTSHPERRTPARHRLDVKERDRSRIPTLDWIRARETRTVAAPLLTTVEKIEPAAWIGSLRRQPEQGDLFGSFDRYVHPEKAKHEWYEHRGNWSNRLVHGCSKRVMASLLEHEHMAGAVQCVYFDPPYGMDFDASCMDDTVQVTAFRDSYEGGIHTYLDGIREVAVLARELLSDSGSFFMQIGDVNVHRCAMVLDEVFGPENRVSTITYATTGGGSSTKGISKSADYILWYAKDRDAPMAFHPLYEEQTVEEWCDTQTFAGGGGDFPDGTSRALKPEERRDPKRNLPKDVDLWVTGPLCSQGASNGEQGQPFTYRGVQYGPKGLNSDHWRVDQAGLRRLADTGRLWSNVSDGDTLASCNQLRLKIYRNEMPGRRLTNLWANAISTSDKRYPVQTGDLAIQRCVLMTTRPGDLVLDPTGGGGTTALVAETWGRRWISIDSSRHSLAVSRERVLVHDYPNWLVLGSDKGFKEERKLRLEAGQEQLESKPAGVSDPATGFVMERMRYVSASTLAYAEREDKSPKREYTWFVDRLKGRQSGRVCSRFTVETELLEVYQRPEEMVRPAQARRDLAWQERVIHALDGTGVRSDSGQHWDVEGLESLVGKDDGGRTPGILSHGAVLVDRQSGRKRDAVVAVWPEDAKVDVGAIQRNVQDVMRRGLQEVLIVAGAEFGDVGSRWAVEVMKVRGAQDLHLNGVKAKPDDSSLILVAEPAVEIRHSKDGGFTCTVHGWNEFNPVTGDARYCQRQDIALWMLDTDYDGMQFCARRIHLPGTLRKRENRKVLDRLLGKEGCPTALDAAFGWTSQPFREPVSGKVGVRVVTKGGGMMSWSGWRSDSPG